MMMEEMKAFVDGILKASEEMSKEDFKIWLDALVRDL